MSATQKIAADSSFRATHPRSYRSLLAGRNHLLSFPEVVRSHAPNGARTGYATQRAATKRYFAVEARPGARHPCVIRRRTGGVGRTSGLDVNDDFFDRAEVARGIAELDRHNRVTGLEGCGHR